MSLSQTDLMTYSAKQVASLADVDAHAVRDEGFRRQDVYQDEVERIEAQIARLKLKLESARAKRDGAQTIIEAAFAELAKA